MDDRVEEGPLLDSSYIFFLSVVFRFKPKLKASSFSTCDTFFIFLPTSVR